MKEEFCNYGLKFESSKDIEKEERYIKQETK